MHIVLYKKSGEVMFIDGFKDYTGLFEGAWYFQTTPESGGFQGSDSMELFVDPMSSELNGMGFAGVNVFYKGEDSWDISSLEDFNNNKNVIYTRLSTIKNEAELVPLPGVVAGMYDPAFDEQPFIKKCFSEVPHQYLLSGYRRQTSRWSLSI